MCDKGDGFCDRSDRFLFPLQRDIQNSLTLDGISSSSNLLAATSMRPIAEAVTEVQVPADDPDSIHPPAAIGGAAGGPRRLGG